MRKLVSCWLILGFLATVPCNHSTDRTNLQAAQALAPDKDDTAANRPKGTITIGKDTTYVDGPLDDQPPADDLSIRMPLAEVRRK
jgi:hypothetical protein